MSTATRAPAQNTRPPQQSAAASLLDQILEQPVSERMRAVSSALEKRIHTVEEVLPDSLKSQAARLVKRAELTFARKADLHECEPSEVTGFQNIDLALVAKENVLLIKQGMPVYRPRR